MDSLGHIKFPPSPAEIRFVSLYLTYNLRTFVPCTCLFLSLIECYPDSQSFWSSYFFLGGFSSSAGPGQKVFKKFIRNCLVFTTLFMSIHLWQENVCSIFLLNKIICITEIQRTENKFTGSRTFLYKVCYSL